jgi:hypothetical protein
MLKFVGLLFLTASLPYANTITFLTGGGTEAGGSPISSTADFVTGAGQLTITLKNLQPGITTVAQNISDLEFILSTGLEGSTSMTSSGQDMTCSGAVCTSGITGSTGWGLGTLNGESIICIVCGTANMTLAKSGTPSHTIIGPSPVPQGSLDTGSHNPFVNQTATFTILNSSITANSTISDVVFSFGSEAGDDVPGCAAGSTSCGGTTSEAPEPFSIFLIGGGLLGIGVFGKFRRV